MKNQEHMTPPKDHNNLSLTGPNDKETYNLPEKEFKIAVLMKLNELQENTEDNSAKSGKQLTNKMSLTKR